MKIGWGFSLLEKTQYVNTISPDPVEAEYNAIYGTNTYSNMNSIELFSPSHFQDRHFRQFQSGPFIGDVHPQSQRPRAPQLEDITTEAAPDSPESVSLDDVSQENVGYEMPFFHQ